MSWGEQVGRTRNCKGCIYAARSTQTSIYCDYLTRVGKRRPCPPGDLCTVRVGRRSDLLKVDKEVIYEMHAEGKTARQIAEHFTISTSYVYAILASVARDRGRKK